MNHSKADEALHCCYIDPDELPVEGAGCGEDATVEIIDTSDPNPYNCYTHSCDAHVGALLGHSETAVEDRPKCWEVRPLDEIQVIA